MATYQTIPMPNETIQGLFPTIDWFQKISKYIDFRGKVILDVGCCDYSYGVQCIQAGAKKVIGIEPSHFQSSQSTIDRWGYSNKCTVISSKIEDIVYIPAHDISIFSMVIYWIDEAEEHIRRVLKKTKEHSVFIFRPPTDSSSHYQPTIEQLEKLTGRRKCAQEVLMDNPEQHIDLVIFKH